jgi:hypothetical protein
MVGFHWQLGVVQGGASVSVSAPTGARVEDSGGNADKVNFSASGGGSGTIDNGNPLDISSLLGQTISISAYGDTTGGGTVASWSWGIVVVDNGAGLVVSSTPTPPSTQNWTGANYAINFSSRSGEMAIFELQITATNSGGSSQGAFELVFINP